MAIKNIPVQPVIEQSRPATERGSLFKITFRPLNVTVEVSDGQSILESCETHRIPLEHSCGGNCACSTSSSETALTASHLRRTTNWIS